MKSRFRFAPPIKQDETLDLVAYVLSGGDAKNKMFK